MNAARLKSVMVLHGDTSANLADVLGITPQTMSAKINGKATFDQQEIAKIRDKYNLTPEEVNDIFLS